MSRAKCLNCGDTVETGCKTDWECCTCYIKRAMNGGHGIYISDVGNMLRMGGNLEDYAGVILDVDPIDKMQCREE